MDVPDRLRMLRSPSATTRGTALSWLSGALYQQGSRWSASAAVVPILVALVDDPDTPDRESIVSLLHPIVLGDAALPFTPDFSAGDALSTEDLAEVARLLSESKNPFDEAPAEYFLAAAARWAGDAYRAGEAHVSSYAGWLSDPLVAAQAAEFLAYFPADDRTVDALLGSVAPASANLTLGYLDGFPSVDKHLTELLDAPALDVRMTAAVALAFRLGAELPGQALDLLVDEKPPPAPPGWDRSMRGFVTLALRRVGL
ncbi:hypothetical protein CLV71_111106 [Actinophytocola oryzae]|uniref:HEAT repeat protein n=1 Tax=Actinophytocola oryzae TaxID=502181 RepID=A0A4R7VB12_9PSEU|nr:hypothetical protein CLV71_111106 [Actinophytocola oryzae]